MKLELITEDDSTIEFTFNDDHAGYDSHVFAALQPKFVGAMEINDGKYHTSYNLLVRSDNGVIYSIGKLTNVPDDYIPTEDRLKAMVVNQY